MVLKERIYVLTFFEPYSSHIRAIEVLICGGRDATRIAEKYN